MKKLYSGLTALLLTVSAFSQIKYDDGPIITSGNFVTVGTWGRNNITFSFQNGTNDIPGTDEQNAIRQAFQIWADYGNLNFTEVTTNADIVISWGAGNHGDGFPFNGTNGVLAHAFFPPPNGGALSGDIHFDDDETWTLNMQATWTQPIDLVTVAAHEIGHALGLGHSNVACALMNPFYTGSHRYLSQDDIDGIQSIYGNRSVVRSNNYDCSGGTFFINNLPVGATVFWVSSDNSVATVTNNNNQGIVSRVGSATGSVRITGTITLPCGTTVIEFRDIAIGLPLTTYTINPYGGADCYQTNAYYYFSIEPYPNDWQFINAFEWGYRPYNTLGGTIVGDPNSFTTTATIIFPSPGLWEVFVRPKNSCGTGLESIEIVDVVYWCGQGGGGWFRVQTTPNPAKDYLYITIDQEKDEVKTQKLERVNIRLLDLLTGQVKKQWSSPIQYQYKLSVAGINKGQYVLIIEKGKYRQSKQILIE